MQQQITPIDHEPLTLLEEIDEILKTIDLTIEKDGDHYYACRLFLYGSFTGEHNVKQLHQALGYEKEFIIRCIANLYENNIWVAGKTHCNLEGDEAWMEILLCGMAALGQINRITKPD